MEHPKVDGRTADIGEPVTYVDERGRARAALITAVWDAGSPATSPTPAINLVIVAEDVKRNDECGRQMERRTSIPHQSMQTAPGNYWVK
jgi:hypothetical protein